MECGGSFARLVQDSVTSVVAAVSAAEVTDRSRHGYFYNKDKIDIYADVVIPNGVRDLPSTRAVTESSLGDHSPCERSLVVFAARDDGEEGDGATTLFVRRAPAAASIRRPIPNPRPQANHARSV